MNFKRFGMGMLLAATALVGMSALAQDNTRPRTASDFRLNDPYQLGGLGVYCENAQGAAGESFTGGGLSVWSVGGRRIIFVPENEFTGTQTGAGSTTATGNQAQATQDVNATPTVAATAGAFRVVLLATGNAPNGAVQLYQVGENQFLLNGVLEDGKPFQFQWRGCEWLSGFITTEAPYAPPRNVATRQTPVGTRTVTGTPGAVTTVTSLGTQTPQGTQTQQGSTTGGNQGQVVTSTPQATATGSGG
ncbi:MAG: hypothetical protein SF162_15445 [bacterium]|nr:hypothetical protein [bacterium]